MSSQDSADHSTQPWLEWVPAHKSRTDVGRLLIPDGSRLTELEWWCNRAVDLPAKAAAAPAKAKAPAKKAPAKPKK